MRKLLTKLAALLVAADSLRFDLWHSVETRPTLIDFKGKGDFSTDFAYLPTRPSVIARVLREVPVEDHRRTHFIDLGCGKGRVVLLAAAYPFKKITGIELRQSLYEKARANARHQRRFKTLAPEIELVNKNALDFDFPDDDLVLFLFNPFSLEIMSKVLIKLREFLVHTGRSVVIAMINSEFDDLMELHAEFQLVTRSRLRSIYQSKQTHRT